MNDDIFKKTLDHLEESIKLTKLLNIDKFGFHAGFYYNIPLSQIGKIIAKKTLFNKNESLKKFCNAFNFLKNKYPNIKLYLENNVISHKNLNNFDDNLFMLTNSDEYFELCRKIDFKFILDIAHLKVSANSLKLNFERELESLIGESDYIHVSDNDGFTDQNLPLKKQSNLYSILSQYSLKNKIVTLEVYDTLRDIMDSYNLISKLK